MASIIVSIVQFFCVFTLLSANVQRESEIIDSYLSRTVVSTQSMGHPELTGYHSFVTLHDDSTWVTLEEFPAELIGQEVHVYYEEGQKGVYHLVTPERTELNIEIAAKPISSPLTITKSVFAGIEVNYPLYNEKIERTINYRIYDEERVGRTANITKPYQATYVVTLSDGSQWYAYELVDTETPSSLEGEPVIFVSYGLKGHSYTPSLIVFSSGDERFLRVRPYP